MEIRRNPSDDKRGKSFPSSKVARPRTLKQAYVELRARFKALKRSSADRVKQLRYRLDQEELNGWCIQECRDYLERVLGVNAAVVPGLNIASPFFDDIFKTLVNYAWSHRRNVQNYHQQLAQTQTALAFAQAQIQAQNAAATQYASSQANVPMYAALGGGFGVPTTGSTTPYLYYGTASTANAISTTSVGGHTHYITGMPLVFQEPILKIEDGQPRTVILPDGTEIHVKTDGSYTIQDKDAKVVYRANRMREFNRYINASDLLTDFIAFCGREAKVGREEMLELPIKLFIQYLILEAAKADGEPEPADIPLVPDLRRAISHECPGCGSFIPPERRARKLTFCGADCFAEHERRTLECIAA